MILANNNFLKSKNFLKCLIPEIENKYKQVSCRLFKDIPKNFTYNRLCFTPLISRIQETKIGIYLTIKDIT